MNLFKTGEPQWKLRPFADNDFALSFNKPPNRFHRFMQRLVLGFRWERPS